MDSRYWVSFFVNPAFREKQPSVRWIAKKLSVLEANTWTGLRVPFFLAALAYLWIGMPTTGLLVATLGFITDGIDGLVARSMGMEGGKFGSLFDGSVDKLILLLIAYLGWNLTHPSVLIILGIVEFFGVPIIGIFFRREDKNIFEHLMVGKYKFVLQIALFYVLWMAKYLFPNWEWWTLWANVILSVIIILAIFSVICKVNIKLEKFLADSITLENFLCGVVSTTLAIMGNFEFAAALILIATVFDILDGMVARKVGSSGSKYGDIKDSAGDLMSFGVAPACLFFFSGVMWPACLLFFYCTFIRLSYYLRVHSPGGVFAGFPCPAAAIAVSSFLLWDGRISVVNLEAVILFCAIAEVSFIFDTFFSKVEFKWYHAKMSSKMPGKVVFFFLAALGVLFCIGRTGEGFSFYILSYFVLFYKPVADRLWGWGNEIEN